MKLIIALFLFTSLISIINTLFHDIEMNEYGIPDTRFGKSEKQNSLVHDLTTCVLGVLYTTHYGALFKLKKEPESTKFYRG